jgi:hypothetical protein
MTPNGLDPTKWGVIGTISSHDLLAWFLTPSQNLPGESLKQESPSKGKRPSKKRVEELAKQEAAIRRFRLTAKHRRAKVVVNGPNPLAGITLKGAGKKKPGGTRRTAGVSVSTAMKPSTGTAIRRFWLSTRICGHCKGRGLWSKGFLGECRTCNKFTDLRK